MGTFENPVWTTTDKGAVIMIILSIVGFLMYQLGLSIVEMVSAAIKAYRNYKKHSQNN